MSENRIKVTDRRMFTADGELRQEFREAEAAASSPKPASPAAVEPAARDTSAVEISPTQARPSGPIAGAAGPGAAPELETDASFRDLVAILAQSASTYLSQASQMGAHPQANEMIEMARLHIDLLRILKHKSTGNLEPTEESLLDDALSSLQQAALAFG